MGAEDPCEAQVKRAKTGMGLGISILEAQDDVYDKTQRTPTNPSKIVWNGIANWQTTRQSNYTRLPVLVWTITKFKRKTWKTKVNCQKFAPILY